MPVTAAWGADVVAVDVAQAPIWRRLEHLAVAGTGRLHIPVDEWAGPLGVDLLAVDQPRPTPDPAWPEPLRARVEAAARRAVDDLPPDVTLRLNKSALDALNCDGRYLDLRAQPFEWSPRLLLGKLPRVPRYRQRVRPVPLHLGRPLWVDDEHFQILYHVRHTAVPRPGGAEQLRNLAGRVLSHRLDMAKPLWEAWLVEGLEHATDALNLLFTGGNTGKVIVKV